MKKFMLLAAAAALVAPAVASAKVVYVGSWQVDQGPSWQVVPTAFSGQQAAAFIFGGVASKYKISTVDNTVANIDNLAWMSTWGGACGGTYPCGTQFSESFVTSTLGLYANPGDSSAYVQDWAIGSQYVNYAFLSTVPEPATWAMMIAGFGMVGGAMRRRSTKVAFV